MRLKKNNVQERSDKILGLFTFLTSDESLVLKISGAPIILGNSSNTFDFLRNCLLNLTAIMICSSRMRPLIQWSPLHFKENWQYNNRSTPCNTKKDISFYSLHVHWQYGSLSRSATALSTSSFSGKTNI